MKRERTYQVVASFLCAIALTIGPAICYIRTQLFEPPVHLHEMAVGAMSIVSLFLGVCFLAVEIVTAIYTREASYETAIMTGFIIAYVLFSPDMAEFIGLVGVDRVPSWLSHAGNIAFLGMTASMLAYFRKKFTGDRRRYLIAYCVLGTICVLVYPFVSEYQFGMVPVGIMTAACIIYHLYFFIRATMDRRFNRTFVFLSVLFYGILGMHLTNTLYYEFFAYTAEGYTIGYTWAIYFCYIMIYIESFVIADREANLVEDYKAESEQLKNAIISEQLMSHFVMSALEKLKYVYANYPEQGQKMMGLIQGYIRESSSLAEKPLIPFKDEVLNIRHFLNIENALGVGKFKVRYDMAFKDFKVPPMSVQAFVENAVAYSKVDEKGDGVITIATRKVDDLVTVVIRDNGVGFDPNAIVEGKLGISNSRKRIESILDGEIRIVSDAAGTEVKIIVPAVQNTAKSHLFAAN